MNLTSLRRMKYALGLSNEDQDHILARLVGAASGQILKACKRRDQEEGSGFELKSRTEYMDPTPGQRDFYPLAYPITEITSIHTDGTGVYSGAEQELDASWYTLASDRRSIVFNVTPKSLNWTGFPVMPRGVRAIYTAGLAADPVVSTWETSVDAGGTMAAGNYVQGEDSLSVGRITARGATSISIEVLAGFFTAEEITEFKDADFAKGATGLGNPSGVTATLTTNLTRCLAEACPDLVEACEMQVNFLRANRETFNMLTVAQDGGTKVSRSDLKNRYGLLPEIMDMLEPYINKLVA